VPVRLQYVGPRFGLHFGIREEVTNYRQAAQANSAMLRSFVAGCIARGSTSTSQSTMVSPQFTRRRYRPRTQGDRGALDDVRREFPQ